jgi:hypothetical protein
VVATFPLSNKPIILREIQLHYHCRYTYSIRINYSFDWQQPFLLPHDDEMFIIISMVSDGDVVFISGYETCYGSGSL